MSHCMRTVQQPVHGYRTESSAGALHILIFVHAHSQPAMFTCWRELCVFVHGAPVLGGGGYLNACSLPDSLFAQTCTHTMHGLRPMVVLRQHHSLQDSSRWMPHLRVLLSRQEAQPVDCAGGFLCCREAQSLPPGLLTVIIGCSHLYSWYSTWVCTVDCQCIC